MTKSNLSKGSLDTTKPLTPSATSAPSNSTPQAQSQPQSSTVSQPSPDPVMIKSSIGNVKKD